MGALYVKDDEARRMAEELALQRGLTKVAAVKLALANELAKGSSRPSLVDIGLPAQGLTVRDCST